MSVSVTNDGFTLDAKAITWSSVQAIATYKHDLFSYDDICLAFKVSDATWVEVSEEEPGFQLLVDEVELRYPEVPRDWLDAVMLPAFARNYRVVWGVA